MRHRPRSTPFPYTTLFRSIAIPKGVLSNERLGSGNLDYAIPVFDGIYTLILYFSENCAIQVDRKSTRLNSSHVSSSYAVFCLKEKALRRIHLLITDPAVIG